MYQNHKANPLVSDMLQVPNSFFIGMKWRYFSPQYTIDFKFMQ